MILSLITNAQTERYSIVINEILADPSPIVGLPNSEYIELRNISNQPINLFKWKIDNGSTSATITSFYMLNPDSIVVLCSKTQVLFFNEPGKTIGLTSFPSLSNEGDILTLTAADGKTIHSVEYYISWFKNSVKSNGGWSLEMIDPFKPCDKNNWSGSVHPLGGTPGRENSIFKKNSAIENIEALQCIALNKNQLLLKINQGADSSSLSDPKNYRLGDSRLQPISANAIGPVFKTSLINFSIPLEENKIYTLNVSSILHCRSTKRDSLKIRTGLTILAESGDLVINEILFDPPANGADFVEYRNNSLSVINAKDIFLSNKNSAGLVGTAYASSETDFNIFPGEYFVVTTDSTFLRNSWTNADKNHLSEIKYMPSYPDNKGVVLLLNKQGKIIDELRYADDMHFPLLRDKSGVSLEKINPYNPSKNQNDWHSASSSSGYGTPTLINSQFNKMDTSNNTINIQPAYFSPNNDGQNDILSIQYNFLVPGNMISVYAFDQHGMLIQKIADNQLCGTSGTFIWDGFDNKKQRASPGIYIILSETLNMLGKRMRFKKAVVVG